MRKLWQGLAYIFAVILLAHFLLATVSPFIPTIICLGVVATVFLHFFDKHRRW